MSRLTTVTTRAILTMLPQQPGDTHRFRLATPTTPPVEICHFKNICTLEDAYPLAVKVWNALTTLTESQHCNGFLIQEEHLVTEDGEVEWTTLLTINYRTHER